MSRHITRSPEETLKLGESIAKNLYPGTIVGLEGTLGAGKTALCKGIARGLGILEDVTSPTFTLLSMYDSDVPLYHFDCYRIESDEEMDSIGAEEYLYGQGISLVEWYSKLPDYFPEQMVSIHIDIGPDQERIFEIKGVSV